MEITLEDETFYRRLYMRVAAEREGAFLTEACAAFSEEYNALSFRIERSAVGEGCSVRNLLLSRKLATLLIDEGGALRREELIPLVAFAKENLYPTGPEGELDAPRREHLLFCLELLESSDEVRAALAALSRPWGNPQAEELIRQTLQLTSDLPLTDGDVRRAALSAWLCMLRQSVGSCFATAPAILLHDEEPLAFFRDLKELIETGRLTRIWGEVEFSVPLSFSWGIGDLRRPLLLPRRLKEAKGALWLSPHLQEAAVAAELIEEALPPKERSEALGRRLQTLLKEWEGSSPYVVTSPEELIERMLFGELKIDRSAVEEELLRSAAAPSPFLVAAPNSRSGAAAFLQRRERAFAAFKALSDNALLKAWEFTLASMTESRASFSTWNLYASLGFDPKEPEGIGTVIHKALQTLLEDAKREAEEKEEEMEPLYGLIRHLETRIQGATGSEVQWQRSELQARVNEYDSLRQMRDAALRRTRLFSQLFNYLINKYIELFPRYFQEVYDAEMQDISASPYDDSPAGFRLVYKHGRGYTAQWTRIGSPEAFVEALASFFVATENEFLADPDLEQEQISQELSAIVTAIVKQVRRREFLETAFYRMAKAHKTPLIKDPLENLDKVGKKPWVYTSGGSMTTLLTSYYAHPDPFDEVSRWVESPTELLVFLVEAVRGMEKREQELYLADPRLGLLMQSPTHAFILRAASPLFAKACRAKRLAYIWARDEFIAKRERFIDAIGLTEEEMGFLTEEIVGPIEEGFRYLFTREMTQIYGIMSPIQYRQALLPALQRAQKQGFRALAPLGEEGVDGALFSLLPLTPRHRLQEALKELLGAIVPLEEGVRGRALAAAEEVVVQSSFVTAEQLRQLAAALVLMAARRTALPFELPRAVAEAARACTLAFPEPLLFADTNWVRDRFAFLVGPGTGKLELWRVDPIGCRGAPMHIWKQWLDGSRRDIPWVLFHKPHQYRWTPPTTLAEKLQRRRQ